MANKMLLLVTMGLLGIALLFCIISVAGQKTGWLNYSATGVSGSCGLKSCTTKVAGMSSTSNLTNNAKKGGQAGTAFLILAIFAEVIALALAAMVLIGKGPAGGMMGIVLLVVCLVAGFCCLVGFAAPVGGFNKDKTSGLSYKYTGWGVALSVIAWLFCWAAGPVGMMASKGE